MYLNVICLWALLCLYSLLALCIKQFLTLWSVIATVPRALQQWIRVDKGNGIYKIKQEVLERTNRLLSLIRHGPHWKRRVQQFLYCCVCIRYRGNLSTEPLPSNYRGIFTEPLPSNDMGIFTEPLPSNDREDTQTATWSHKPTYVFKIRKVGWK
jgi:hypothetical protein